jgi:hypothetical protein
MKTFKASHLVKKPAEVFAEARLNGAIIQQCRTNGEIVEEFLLIANTPLVHSGHSIQMVRDMTES